MAEAEGFELDGGGATAAVSTAFGAGTRGASSARVTTGGSGAGGGAIVTVVGGVDGRDAGAGGEAVEGEALGGAAGFAALAAAGEAEGAEEGEGVGWVRAATCGSGVLAGGEGFGPDGDGATAAVAEGVGAAGAGARGVSSARVTTGGAGAGGGAIMIVVVVAGIDGGDAGVAAPADGGADWARAATCGSGALADEEGFAPGGDGATAAATNGVGVVTGFGGRDVVEDIDVEEETGA